MTLQQVFKKAVEGGFTLRGIGVSEFYTLLDKYKYESLMSPLFWKAYGKAMGWNKRVRMCYEGYCIDDECNTDYRIDECWLIDESLYYRHRLIDHIDDGGTLESFFDQF